MLLADGSHPGVAGLLARIRPHLPLGVDAIDVSRDPVDLVTLGIPPSRLAGTMAWIRTDGIPAFDADAVAHAATTFGGRKAMAGHMALVPPGRWLARPLYRWALTRLGGPSTSRSASASSRTA